jgi:16S rRNA (cytidine1402-2'-O)-methyltransferase
VNAQAGKLFLVGTPIGNLEDITLRALRVLREADLILAEDTRRTMTLLARHDIRKPLLSCHEFNEARRVTEILARLREGQNVALVTDAGMPTVSDPGLRLVRAVLEAELPVEIVPGPSAITATIAGSGLVTGPWLFYGFLPHKSGQRRKALANLAPLPYALVFFESPYRLLKSLADMREAVGNRRVVVGRELTKKYEEFLRGTLDEVLKRLENRSVKGEITVLVEAP